MAPPKANPELTICCPTFLHPKLNYGVVSGMLFIMALNWWIIGGYALEEGFPPTIHLLPAFSMISYLLSCIISSPISDSEVLIKAKKLSKHVTRCENCQSLRYPEDGAEHCQFCGICTAGYDHHCGLIGNCVGEKNKIFFLSFCLGLSICCFFNIYSTPLNLLISFQSHSYFYYVCIIFSYVNSPLLWFLGLTGNPFLRGYALTVTFHCSLLTFFMVVRGVWVWLGFGCRIITDMFEDEEEKKEEKEEKEN